MICMYQECNYLGCVYGMGFMNLDFVVYVCVFGVYGEMVECIVDFVFVFECVLICGLFVVIEICILQDVSIFVVMFEQICEQGCCVCGV